MSDVVDATVLPLSVHEIVSAVPEPVAVNTTEYVPLPLSVTPVICGARAWLGAYALAHQLSFTEAVALRQADAAWDRVAELWHQPLRDEPDDEFTEPGRRAVDLPR